MTEPAARYQAELDFATSLAKEAGAIARRYYASSIGFETKSDNSPLTIADTEINRLVIERCQAAYPEANVIGEEERAAGSDADLAWVCDPIDGTLPFTIGIPASTFNLTLVKKGRPVLGVIYDFHSDRLLSAMHGGQLLLNGTPCSPVTTTQRVVDHEGSKSSPHKLPGLKEALFNQDYRVVTYCSTAYMAMQVVLGNMAGVVYTNQHPWDVAAVNALAEAAGCRMSDLDGNEQAYDSAVNGAVIARPEHYDAIMQAIAEVRHV